MKTSANHVSGMHLRSAMIRPRYQQPLWRSRWLRVVLVVALVLAAGPGRLGCTTVEAKAMPCPAAGLGHSHDHAAMTTEAPAVHAPHELDVLTDVSHNNGSSNSYPCAYCLFACHATATLLHQPIAGFGKRAAEPQVAVFIVPHGISVAPLPRPPNVI